MSELIVKDNALIQASYTLDTVEQRLILLAIAEARETGHGITENSLLEVHASSYINTFNVGSFRCLLNIAPSQVIQKVCWQRDDVVYHSFW